LQEVRQMRRYTNRKADIQEGRQEEWFKEGVRHTGGQKTRHVIEIQRVCLQGGGIIFFSLFILVKG
jgi:hypothetical protein